MRLSRTGCVGVCGIVLVALAGCDQGAAKIKMPDVSPAAGVVTYNGEPVDGAQVLFVSDTSKSNAWACGGATDESGKFEITTTVSSTQAKGVPPGEYVVLVTKVRATTPEEQKEAQEEFFAKKAAETDPAKQQKLEQEFRQQLGGGPLVPAKYGDQKTSDLKVTVGADGNTDIDLKLVD